MIDINTIQLSASLDAAASKIGEDGKNKIIDLLGTYNQSEPRDRLKVKICEGIINENTASLDEAAKAIIRNKYLINDKFAKFLGKAAEWDIGSEGTVLMFGKLLETTAVVSEKYKMFTDRPETPLSAAVRSFYGRSLKTDFSSELYKQAVSIGSKVYCFDPAEFYDISSELKSILRYAKRTGDKKALLYIKHYINILKYCSEFMGVHFDDMYVWAAKSYDKYTKSLLGISFVDEVTIEDLIHN